MVPNDAVTSYHGMDNEGGGEHLEIEKGTLLKHARFYFFPPSHGDQREPALS